MRRNPLSSQKGVGGVHFGEVVQSHEIWGQNSQRSRKNKLKRNKTIRGARRPKRFLYQEKGEVRKCRRGDR